MKISPVASIILLTCNSHLDKGFCIRHCLYSLLNQSGSPFEIIVVDNGSDNQDSLIDLIHQVQGFIKMKNLPLSIYYERAVEKVSRGKARNIGVEKAKSDLIVFIDDDAILSSTNMIEEILANYENSVWGLGALRLWSQGNLFQENADSILARIQENDYSTLLSICNNPESGVRDYKDAEAEFYSFIGHLGYCQASAFKEAGMFPDYHLTNSCEDDFLQMRLFKNFGNPGLLKNIKLVHVNHPTMGSRKNDFAFYFSQLVKEGVYSFDSVALLAGDFRNVSRELLAKHYDEKLLECYSHYESLFPLHYSSLTVEEQNSWNRKMRLTLHDFTITVNGLMSAKTIDDFLSRHPADLDSLGPVLQSLQNSGVLSIGPKSVLKENYKFEYYFFPENKQQERPEFIPRFELNQFPCDMNSLMRRLSLLQSRHPFTDFLRIGLVGDDDHFHRLIENEYWLYPVVIDLDERIIRSVQESSHRFVGKLFDIRNVAATSDPHSLLKLPRCETFLCDPPYTVSGTLSFILAGLYLLEQECTKEKEFYVILNPMIMGRKINEMLKTLSAVGIDLILVESAFNSYLLPKNYPESVRASDFFENYRESAPLYSSTSSLYIFRFVQADLDMLRMQIRSDEFYSY